MSRPRLLIIPNVSELEWRVRDRLGAWADVAFLERAFGSDREVADAAAHELERRGWPSAVLVSDEWAVVNAVALATHHPELIEALVLGHACVALRTEGERPTINGPVAEGYRQILQADYRTFARTLTQVTQGDFDEELVNAFVQRVPHEDALRMWARAEEHLGVDFEPVLRALDVPILLVQHKGCLLWTDDSFADAKAAFPEARTAVFEEKPSVNPDFAHVLREFCMAAADSAAART